MFHPEFVPPPKDRWEKMRWQVSHPELMPKKEKVSSDRYIFIHSLKFEELPHDAPTEDKIAHVAVGILKHIPILSLAVEAPHLFETIRNRVIYEFDSEKKYVYDVRFSGWSIAQSIVYALGLGILITPFRIAAEFMRSEDKGKEPFSNPHLLDQSDLEWAIWDVRGSDTTTLASYFPENPQFCYQVLMRDHHLHPELLFNTLYPSQIDNKNDLPYIEKFKRLCETNPDFKQLLRRKSTDLNPETPRIKEKLVPRDELMKILQDIPVNNKN